MTGPKIIKMKFNLVSIFPELINDYLQHGLFSKALDKEILKVKIWNPRDYSEDISGRIDDKPFGGGGGMLFKAEPIIRTVSKIKESEETHVVFAAPHGNLLNQEKIINLKSKSNLTIICGRYEGIDNRVEETIVDEVISIGDYILNGGELAALVIMEAVARLKEGFIGSENSLIDSFSEGLLEHPQYTRPEKGEYGNVPEILLSGNHNLINRWRLKESLRITLKYRPDLIAKKELSDQEIELINEIKDE